jgi:osmotically-inducible protein OsmY
MNIRVALLACALVTPLQSHAADAAKETPGQFIDDAAITAKVKADMIKDKTVPASTISVETTHGVVNLSGAAKNREEAQKAVSLARAVKGVKAVENHIETK